MRVLPARRLNTLVRQPRRGRRCLGVGPWQTAHRASAASVYMLLHESAKSAETSLRSDDDRIARRDAPLMNEASIAESSAHAGIRPLHR